MTAHEFNTLEINAKADVLWPDAKFVDHRLKDESLMVVIYSLFDFFVEVSFDIHSKNIAGITALVSEKDWNSYLNSISLDQLMK